MPPCLCRRGFVLGLASAATTAWAQSPADHAVLHAALRDADALDPYVNEGLGEMIAALGRAYGIPAALNVPPPPGGTMVLLVRPERERRQLSSQIGLPTGLLASPIADPTRRIIWIDSDFLRRLAMRISLFAGASLGGAGLGSVAAVAQTEITPPPARPELWQEGQSPALTQPILLLISRGAGGFLLAHEMAHVLAGPAPALPTERADLPRRARQLASACPQLTDPRIVARRAYEAEADSRALEAVLLSGAALGQGAKGLPGELGIATLLTLTLGAEIVRVGSTVDAPLPQRMLEMQVGRDMFRQLREQWEQERQPQSALMRMVYSDTHPAAVQRLIDVMHQLARRPGSLWYGDSDPTSGQGALLGLQGLICAEAQKSLQPG